jgi:hypothetical protein
MPLSDAEFDDLVKAPKSATTDEGSVSERSVEELIKADQYGKTKEGIQGPPYGLRIARVRPPGTV